MSSAILEAAFLATIYRVELPEGCFSLRIGVDDSVFDGCLRAQGVDTWGILTACNPGAKRLSDDENRHRYSQLCKRVEEAGLRFFPACNLDAVGEWPSEPGCFIPRIGREQLCALARDFSQLAVVWSEVGSPPRLLWV